MLENDFYEKQSTTDRHDIFDFVVNLEVLQGCSHSCAGCFVNLENPNAQVETVLTNALKFGTHYVEHGARFREIFIGATDIFTARNSEEILRNPLLHKMTHLKGSGDVLTSGNTVGDQNLGLTTTAVFDGIELDNVKRIFDILDNHGFYREKMTVEFLIPVNIKKVLDQDAKYIEDHQRVFEFFANETPKHVIYSFANNIFNNRFLKEDGAYEKARDLIKENYNCILEHNPSFFRSGKASNIGTNILAWKDILELQLTDENWKETHLTATDLHHNSVNTLGVHFTKTEAYLIPFIYENIFLEREKFLIKDATNPLLASEKYAQLMGDGFKYASDCTDCSNCEMLVACVGRNVQNVMEEFGMKDCVFPKQFREKFNPNPRG